MRGQNCYRQHMGIVCVDYIIVERKLQFFLIYLNETRQYYNIMSNE